MSPVKMKVLSSIAHAIRAPFTSIIGFSDILNALECVNNDAEARNCVDIINKSGHELLHRVDALIWILKAEHRAIEENCCVPINEVFDTSIDQAIKCNLECLKFLSKTLTKMTELLGGFDPPSITIYQQIEIRYEHGTHLTEEDEDDPFSAFSRNGIDMNLALGLYAVGKIASSLGGRLRFKSHALVLEIPL